MGNKETPLNLKDFKEKRRRWQSKNAILREAFLGKETPSKLFENYKEHFQKNAGKVEYPSGMTFFHYEWDLNWDYVSHSLEMRKNWNAKICLRIDWPNEEIPIENLKKEIIEDLYRHTIHDEDWEIERISKEEMIVKLKEKGEEMVNVRKQKSFCKLFYEGWKFYDYDKYWKKGKELDDRQAINLILSFDAALRDYYKNSKKES